MPEENNNIPNTTGQNPVGKTPPVSDPGTEQTDPAGSPPGKESPTNKKPLLTIIIAILVTLALAGGYLLWQNSQKQAASPIDSPKPTAEAVDPTADWKTYTNTENGYSFKYPSTLYPLNLDPEADSQFFSSKEGAGAPLEIGADGFWVDLTVFDESNTKSLDGTYGEIINKLKINGSADTAFKETITKLSELDTNGVKGATYISRPAMNFEGEPVFEYGAVWLKSGRLYKLVLGAINENELQKQKELFDQILSTFKFTDSKLTYTNLKYGYSFKYPDYFKEGAECAGAKFDDDKVVLTGCDSLVIQVEPINTTETDPLKWWSSQTTESYSKKPVNCFTTSSTTNFKSQYYPDQTINTFDKQVLSIKTISSNECGEPPADDILVIPHKGKLIKVIYDFAVASEDIISSFKLIN